MKLHIFVATTQGLVAIQNITPIDDTEINSVVSVNGTSTTANISNAYHNFVKKGAGIIAQDFNFCSYRLNISERIDNGNSWQLAFYLAHAASEKNILGDGNAEPGDQVICATGEVNTSTRNVQLVTDVALKIEQAKAPVSSWIHNNIKVYFLVPSENSRDFDTTLMVKPISVYSLKEALAVSPMLSVSNNSVKVTPKKGHKAWLSAIIVTFFLATVIGSKYFYQQWFKQNITLVNRIEPENPLPQGSMTKINTNKPNISSNIKNKQRPVSGQYQLTAFIAQKADCQLEPSRQTATLEGSVFNQVKLNHLCQLQLTTPKNIINILLVAADTKAIIVLDKLSGYWRVPLPKKRSTDRKYHLVLLKEAPSSPAVQRKKTAVTYKNNLHQYLQSDLVISIVKANHLKQWLKNNNIHGEILSHHLDSY